MLLSLLVQRSASFKPILTPSKKFGTIPLSRSVHTSLSLRQPNVRSVTCALRYARNPISSWTITQIHLKQERVHQQGLRLLSVNREADSWFNTEVPMVYPTFDETMALHPLLKKNIGLMKLKTMTEIQARTWQAASTGFDVLGRARTGTGKTVAFLLPAINQLLVAADEKKLKQYNTIQMLVLSPTRELAAQIYDQAVKLTASSSMIECQVMFGGSSKPKDISTMVKRRPTILVSTPGRLKDHLETTKLFERPLKSFFDETQILVLDETDRYVYCMDRRRFPFLGSPF
jgi:DEAD/DEAH box helicase